MSSCCPVCYRATKQIVTETEEFGKVEKLQKRFFELFERYLNQDNINAEVGEGKHSKFLPVALAETGMVSCGQCLELMESFSQLFHQLKTTELLIAWKVETLKNIMKCAGKVPSRIVNLQNFMRGADVTERVDEIIKSRRSLIQNCCKKMTNSFPKLSIRKWRHGGTTSSHGQGISTKVMNSDGPLIVSPRRVAEVNQPDNCPVKGPYGNVLPNPTSTSITMEIMTETIIRRDTKTGGETDQTPTTVAEVKQSLACHDDDENYDAHISINESDHGPTVDNTEDMGIDSTDNFVAPPKTGENAEAKGTPPPNFQPVIKLESDGDKVQTNMEHDVDVQVAHSSRHANQIQPDFAETHTDIMSTDNTLLPHETHTKIVPRLRSCHRCQHCGRTFSSDERLQLHKTEVHIDDDDMGDQAENELFANDSVQDEGIDDQSDIMSCLSSSSSSDEEDDNLDFEGYYLSDAKIDKDTAKTYSDKYESNADVKYHPNRRRPKKYMGRRQSYPHHQSLPRKPNPRSESPMRLKCPDCSILMTNLRDFLLHHKTSKSCRDSYDPKASVKVDVLALPKDVKTKATLIDSNFVNLAIVDLPLEIYSCESCDMAVYSLEDMEAHKKLHGTFTCSFCEVTESYAPDLALHELEKHLQKPKRDKTSSWCINCSRCDFGCHTRIAFVRHYLPAHLNLAFNDPKCPICKTNSGTMAGPGSGTRMKFQIGPHLKTHHDLSNVTNNRDSLKRCQADNCHAYFITGQQLAQHETLRHGQGKRKFVKNSRTNPHSFTRCRSVKHCLKCPDCNTLFPSTEELLIHRKTSDSCSGMYDPSQSVKVEVLVRLREPTNRDQDGGDALFTNVHAIIDLPQAIFVCDIDNCKAVQYSSEDMESHKKLHGTFPCSFCKTEVTTASKLSIHELEHSKKKTWNKSFPSKTVYSCPRCNFKAANREPYIQHHVTNHLSLILNEPVCAICKTHNVDLGRKKGLQAEHFKNMHDLGSVTIPEDIQHCTIANCGAYFLSTKQLAEHLYLHHNIGVDGRKNRWNKKTVNPSKSVKIGEERRRREGIHKCRDCKKSYTIANKLWAHRIKRHVDPNKLIPCTVPKCVKAFESMAQLKHHMARGSTYHKSLDTPMPVEEVYVHCPQCSKSVSGKSPYYLAKHLKSHGRSRYFCEVCGKTFKENYQLEMHLLWHSGPESWKFQCGVCSKKCISKDKLEEHRRTHTQDKPFVCQFCGAKYAHRHNLRIHVNNKHGDEMEDKPRKSNTTALTTKKGAKRKQVIETDESETSDAP